MICELVGVVEWWKKSEDQMYDDGKGCVGDRMDWIGCRESSICHEGDFEDDAIMDR